MKMNWKWLVGITLILIVLAALPFVWQLIFPATNVYGYGYGYGMHMPMMGYSYGYGTMVFGMLFMWLIPASTLILIVLGIVWLVKQLTAKSS